LPELKNHPRYSFALEAYQAMLRWQEHLDVRGDALLNFLMNERDDGIIAYVSCDDPKDTDTAFLALGFALDYTAWHAYQVSNEPMPEGIEDSTEEHIHFLMEQATKGRSFDEGYAQRVYDYLRSKYTIDKGDDFGEPIDMAEVKRAATAD
jgi:hypothetical protein